MPSLSRIAVVVSVVLVLGCGGSGSDGPTCDQVCAISNGATAATATTYWKVPGTGNCITSPCAKLIAFFGDGTGRLKSGGNNCPNGAVSGSTPIASSFTWIKTGPSTVLLSGAAFACSLDPQPTGGDPFGSFVAITGGVASGVFSASIGGTSTVQLSLVAGTL
jgi:hypothetical protein